MPANDKLQIRLNSEQKQRLKDIAESRQVTVTDVIKDAIAEQWFKLKFDQSAVNQDSPQGGQ